MSSISVPSPERGFRRRTGIILSAVSFAMLSGCLFTAPTGGSDDGADAGGEPDAIQRDTGVDGLSDTDESDAGDAGTGDAGDAGTPPHYPTFLRFTSGTRHNATGGEYSASFTVESGRSGTTMTGGEYRLKLAPVPATPVPNQ